jgi:flagellar basal body rod protein FlgC
MSLFNIMKIASTGMGAESVRLTATTASAGAHHGNDSSGDSQAATRRAAEREAVAWQDEVNALRSKFREACTLVSGQPLSRDHSGSGIIL